ncbi:alpha/beta fold hydrolase [Spongiivirga citrea]|uniref:Alpha/beta fold hydrolase n=1 Tax=Spongiivirga citrea TaxID=1481457 RepID=A0A6M0CG34_9FLAO|nr:alpha/beta hydrolase [Spongiivirga citrea]NER15843.1 alpha/beta fold hydrolase [Spongiivirga citrea]
MAIKKKLGFVLKVIVAVIAIVLILSYAPDKEVSQLQEEYTYFDSDFIQVGDQQVHYRKTGTGPALLLLHGTGSSIQTWEQWTRLLKKDFTIISVDLPAYGLTGPNPTADYSIKSYVSFVDEFVEAIGIDSFFLAGNSLGGSIAWNYTYQHPKKVQKLVLLNSSGYPSHKEASMVFKLAKKEYLNKAMLVFTPKFLVKKSLKEVFYDKSLVTDEMVNRYYDLQLRKGNRQAFIDRANTPYDVDPKAIQLIRQPTLVLWGDKDAWISVKDAAKFERDLPNAKVIIYKNVGHVPMEEKAEQSAADTKTFLLRN